MDLLMLRAKPLSQFFEVLGFHREHKFLTMDSVNCENLVRREENFISLLDSVQSALVQRVVDMSRKEIAIAFGDSNPEILTPTT